MAPRISLITARSVAFRTKAIVPQKRICPGPTLRPQQRAASDNAASKDDPAAASAESNMHVSEEAAAMSKITGETPPDISQGTPVQEVSQERSAMDVFRRALADAVLDSRTRSGSPGKGTRSPQARNPAKQHHCHEEPLQLTLVLHLRPETQSRTTNISECRRWPATSFIVSGASTISRVAHYRARVPRRRLRAQIPHPRPQIARTSGELQEAI